MPRAWLVAAGIAVALLAGCEGTQDRPVADPVEEVPTAVTGSGEATPAGAAAPAGEWLPGSAPSLSDLGVIVLDGFVRADSTALEGVRLTEAEHNGIIFPELPAGQGETSYPVDLAWQNIQLRNGRSLARQIAWFAGRTVEYQGTECQGPVQRFETFQVHTDCWITFVDGQEGRLRVQLFKDAVERGGRFKLFRYYDEPPVRVVSG